jgi:ketosteroid isomerase-like protein
MKTLLRLLLFIALLPSLWAAAPAQLDPQTLAEVEAADAARVAAMLAGDRDGLNAIFSDDLYFVHATGRVDTKAGYVEAFASKRTVFTKYSYQERHFRQLASGIVQMMGRNLVETPGGQLDLSFLAIWRHENGKWRFVAWHSTRNQPAPAGKKEEKK